MTPSALRRLLAELPDAEADHPVDAGLLGEHALLERQRGPAAADEAYPRVAAHLRTGCERCQGALTDLDALARRSDSARTGPRDPASAPSTDPPAPRTLPEPLEIAEAVALARAIEAERDALRAPLRPDRFGMVDSLRKTARRRSLLLAEAALIRQRLVLRRLFLDRASALLFPIAPAASPSPSGTGTADRRPPGRLPNPKARLLLDDFVSLVDDLARFAARVGRLTADLRRLGDDPRGPARSQSEALVERGLGMAREALGVDQRLVRLYAPLAGMLP